RPKNILSCRKKGLKFSEVSHSSKLPFFICLVKWTPKSSSLALKTLMYIIPRREEANRMANGISNHLVGNGLFWPNLTTSDYFWVLTYIFFKPPCHKRLVCSFRVQFHS